MKHGSVRMDLTSARWHRELPDDRRGRLRSLRKGTRIDTHKKNSYSNVFTLVTMVLLTDSLKHGVSLRIPLHSEVLSHFDSLLQPAINLFRYRKGAVVQYDPKQPHLRSVQRLLGF